MFDSSSSCRLTALTTAIATNQTGRLKQQTLVFDQKPSSPESQSVASMISLLRNFKLDNLDDFFQITSTHSAIAGIMKPLRDITSTRKIN